MELQERPQLEKLPDDKFCLPDLLPRKHVILTSKFGWFLSNEKDPTINEDIQGYWNIHGVYTPLDFRADDIPTNNVKSKRTVSAVLEKSILHDKAV